MTKQLSKFRRANLLRIGKDGLVRLRDRLDGRNRAIIEAAAGAIPRRR